MFVIENSSLVLAESTVSSFENIRKTMALLRSPNFSPIDYIVIKLSPVLLILFLNLQVYSQVGIGTTSPDVSSVLDVNSSKAGVLLPRLTTAERDAIHKPATGLLIYNKTVNSFQYNFGAPWAADWISLNTTKPQAGTYRVGSTVAGWQYYDVSFKNPFPKIPSIFLTFREGTGTTSVHSYTTIHYKVAKATKTGFTIAIYENDSTDDIFIDWMAKQR